jgi:protein phosphatase
MIGEAANFRWQSASKSIVGNVRELNEDACLDLPARGLWVVADGMGGHQAGDVASHMVVNELGRLDSHDRFSAFVDDVEDRLLKVNANLYAMANSGPEPQVIGCTFAGMLAFGAHCLSVWAGDSRVYRRRDARLRQVTKDHSEVEEMIARGEISEEDAQSHPSANIITRAVGGIANLFLDFALDAIADGDRYLICSDGLYKDLAVDEIDACLSRGDCTEACGELIDTVLARECADNVSVIVVDFRRLENGAEAAA